MTPLSDQDRKVLAVAARTYRYTGARDRDALAETGLPPWAFAARVNQLLDEPAALVADPVTVKRLRRLRDRRRSGRSAASAR